MFEAPMPTAKATEIGRIRPKNSPRVGTTKRAPDDFKRKLMIANQSSPPVRKWAQKMIIGEL